VGDWSGNHGGDAGKIRKMEGGTWNGGGAVGESGVGNGERGKTATKRIPRAVDKRDKKDSQHVRGRQTSNFASSTVGKTKGGRGKLNYCERKTLKPRATNLW